MDLLKPTSDQISGVQDFREKNRGSQYFNHLSTISESIPSLGWVTVVRSWKSSLGLYLTKFTPIKNIQTLMSIDLALHFRPQLLDHTLKKCLTRDNFILIGCSKTGKRSMMNKCFMFTSHIRQTPNENFMVQLSV